VFPVRYELRFYIPEDGILRSHRRETGNSIRVFFSSETFADFQRIMWHYIKGVTAFHGQRYENLKAHIAQSQD
jgi:hypothetical protein